MSVRTTAVVQDQPVAVRDAYDMALVAGGFTLAGVLLGAFVTYRFAGNLARANARRDAGRRLREAFAPELGILDPVTGDKTVNVGQLLKHEFAKHRTAVTEFAFHLSGDERDRFEAAWSEYYLVGGSVRFFDYEDEKTGRDTFRKRIHALFKFTDI
jgi:hypothetical protein